MIRMKDIADRAGVSTVTVSKALSGQRGVSEQVRAAILALAEEMQYQQTAQRQPRMKQSCSVGAIVAGHFMRGDSGAAFYKMVLAQLAHELSKSRSALTTEIISDRLEREGAVPAVLREETVEGLIILGDFSENYVNMILKSSEIPIVFMDTSPKSHGRDYVLSDGYYGGYVLTNYLLDRGHTRIGYVGTVLSTSSVTDRYLGYVRALMERNIPVREDWVIADRSRETLLLDEDVYFSLPEELPTAFVCNSDLAAGLLSRKLAHRGLLCPDDISIVGFDHFTELEEAIPFTTYAVDTKEMVRKAASLLLRRIHGDYCRKCVSIVEGRLIEQGSVKTLA